MSSCVRQLHAAHACGGRRVHARNCLQSPSAGWALGGRTAAAPSRSGELRSWAVTGLTSLRWRRSPVSRSTSFARGCSWRISSRTSSTFEGAAVAARDVCELAEDKQRAVRRRSAGQLAGRAVGGGAVHLRQPNQQLMCLPTYERNFYYLVPFCSVNQALKFVSVDKAYTEYRYYMLQNKHTSTSQLPMAFSYDVKKNLF